MARMYPVLDETQLSALSADKRDGEVRVYRACRDALDDSWLVKYRLQITTDERPPRDVEADFALFHQNLGILVIEVKGGRHIDYDAETEKWHATGPDAGPQKLDPVGQAKKAKYVILSELQADPRWGARRIHLEHAVFFPHIDDVERLGGPELKSWQIGGHRELAWFKKWVETCLGSHRGDQERPLGPQGISLAEELFCRSRTARSLLSTDLAEEEVVRLRLTEQQAVIFEYLTYHPRALITGGAGTGKTLLALMRAKDLAREQKRTLLLCFNAPLGDHLKAIVEKESLQEFLHAMTFHELCKYGIKRALQEKSTDTLAEARRAYPRGDEANVQLPDALARSVLELTDWRYDAILIDEAQDFRPEFDVSIEVLLQDEATSLLYLFCDVNQAIYTKPSLGLVRTPPYILKKNCRNTRFIHDAAIRFYRGEAMVPPPIPGAEIELLTGAGPDKQADRIRVQLATLLSKEDVRPEQIVVLIAPSARKRFYYDLLRPLSLPKPTKWSFEEHRQQDTLLVDTVMRFKGLEADAVFVWGLDDIEPQERRELLYVALTRAKSRLYLVGTDTACRSVLQVADEVSALPS